MPHGLMGLSGSTSDVSVVGYTLGGGLPVMGRVFGFAADHVRSADVVTADGQLRTVDAEHEPELFGLLRGGKGNLGIVTSLTFDLFEVKDFYAGGVFYPGSAAQEVLTAFSRWAPALPETVSTSIALLRLPDMDIIPEPMRNQFLVHLRFGHLGDADSGARLLAPMREALPPMMDMVAPMSYADIDMIHMDPPVPVPFLHAGEFLRGFDADVIADLLQEVGPGTGCPLLEVEIRLMGGAYTRVSDGTDAVSGRDEPYILVLIRLMAPPNIELIPAAMASIFKAVSPHRSGRTFVNLHGVPGDEADRARALVGRDLYPSGPCKVRLRSGEPVALPALHRTKSIPGLSARVPALGRSVLNGWPPRSTSTPPRPTGVAWSGFETHLRAAERATTHHCAGLPLVWFHDSP
nr:FAD-binding oxidoreductase [Arthrobacter sp. PAMC25284]